MAKYRRPGDPNPPPTGAQFPMYLFGPKGARKLLKGDSESDITEYAELLEAGWGESPDEVDPDATTPEPKAPTKPAKAAKGGKGKKVDADAE